MNPTPETDKTTQALRELVANERRTLAQLPVAGGPPLVLWLATHAPIVRLSVEDAEDHNQTSYHAAACLSWAWSVVTLYATGAEQCAFPVSDEDVMSRAQLMSVEEYEALPR